MNIIFLGANLDILFLNSAEDIHPCSYNFYSTKTHIAQFYVCIHKTINYSLYPFVSLPPIISRDC